MGKNWKDFITFRRMITPTLIQVLFWIGVVAILLSGTVMFFAGLIGGIREEDISMVFAALLGAPLFTLVGLLLVRLYTELLIVIFRINDALHDIRDLLQTRDNA